MTQYIDKSAVIAEIERRIEALHSTLNEREIAVKFELKDFLSFLNTLEVKEVNLEKETPNKELEDEILALNNRYPEVSFAKLSRIAVRVAKWQKEQDKKGE